MVNLRRHTYTSYNRGKETVKSLAEHHAKVYLAARSQEKADAAITEIREKVPGADIEFLKLDMMDLAGVAASAKELLRYSSSYSLSSSAQTLTISPNSKETKLHGLVNNAGIMAVDFAESSDGYESQFQVIIPHDFSIQNVD